MPQHREEGATEQQSLWDVEEGDGARESERSGGVTRLLGAQVRHHGENTRKAGQEHRGISGKWQVGDERGCDPLGQGNEKGSVRPQYGTRRQRPHREMQVYSLEEGQEEAIP